MRAAIGSMVVAAVCCLSHAAVASSECALKVAEYVERAEAIFDADRLASIRSIETYSALRKSFPVFKDCVLDEIKEEISKSKYAEIYSQSPDLWNFELSDGIAAVGFAYFISRQASAFHYERWKRK